MMMIQKPRFLGRTALVAGALTLVGAACLLAAHKSAANEPAGWSEIRRDVANLEEEMDDLLLDSPNFLVSGSDDAHGIYLDEVGLILTFDASLVDEPFGRMFSFGGVHINRGRVIIRDHDGWDDEEGWDDEDAVQDRDKRKEKDRDDEDSDRRSTRDQSRRARRYERGKEELVDFLVDYGDRVEGLRSGQWFLIVASMDDSRYLRKQNLSRLVVKARVDDLKAHGAGSLSDDALRERIVVEEY